MNEEAIKGNGQICVYVVLGPPAAGKSTWIERRVKQEEGFVLQFDRWLTSPRGNTWFDHEGVAHNWSTDRIPREDMYYMRAMWWGGPRSPVRAIQNTETLYIEPCQPMFVEEALLLRRTATRHKRRLVAVWCDAPFEERVLRNKRRGEAGVPFHVMVRNNPSRFILDHLSPDDTIYVGPNYEE